MEGEAQLVIETTVQVTEEKLIESRCYERFLNREEHT